MRIALKTIINFLNRDYIEFKGLKLPKQRSNQGLASNDLYISETVAQISKFVSKSDAASSYILDFGCGQGRLLNGLVYEEIPFGQYAGIDVDSRAISWCINNLSYPNNVSFTWYNKNNERYNKAGKEINSLPVTKEHYTHIFSNSVFSHLNEIDVRLYAKLLRECLVLNGMLYLTAFTEENVPNCEENPVGYFGEKNTSRLHRVRFNKDYFLEIFTSHGWQVEGYYQNGIERTGQSEIFLKKI